MFLFVKIGDFKKWWDWLFTKISILQTKLSALRPRMGHHFKLGEFFKLKIEVDLLQSRFETQYILFDKIIFEMS